ncbi:unnamed protein product [Periconia digitata]|uniref:Uncharacterized protein n=1 Tax=Periconia digitata TaxID=1303443 RepID=A0A9W4UHW0_9PLEO|nr:unnamed protein product [Periconia digitata]
MILPRQTSSAFDNHYYRFFNAQQPEKTISSGKSRDANGAITMTGLGHFSSSENWLLHFQSGRYFIRNFDYGGEFQLGLETKTSTEPKLWPRSGVVGQQWTMKKMEGVDGNTFVLTNALLGEEFYLGLNELNPVMTKDLKRGTQWRIEMNESAGMPAAGSGMIEDVDGAESLPPSASSSASPSASSSPPRYTAPSSPTTFPSPQTTLSPASNTSPPHMSSGAIAGITIGILALLAALATLVLVLRSRHNKAKKAAATTSKRSSHLEHYPPISSPLHGSFTKLSEAGAGVTGRYYAREKEVFAYQAGDGGSGPVEIDSVSVGSVAQELSGDCERREREVVELDCGAAPARPREVM